MFGWFVDVFILLYLYYYSSSSYTLWGKCNLLLFFSVVVNTPRRRQRLINFLFPSTFYGFDVQAIVGPKGYALKIVKILEYTPRQQLYIELRDKLRKKVNYTLSLRWYSRLSSEPEGFYADQYDSENGVKR